MTKEQRLNWQQMYGVCFDELGCKSQAELPQERFMLWLINKVQLLNKHDVMCRAGDWVKEAGGDWIKVLKVDGSDVYLDYEDGLNALHIDDIIAWRHGT